MQQILIYKDGPEYCARWGPHMPNETAIGFGGSPISAITSMITDLVAKGMHSESVDFEYEPDKDGVEL